MLRNLDTIYDIARSSKNFSTGINFSENFFLVYRGMAVEYVDNEAKIDDTSACTITSPPFAISPDLKNHLYLVLNM